MASSESQHDHAHHHDHHHHQSANADNVWRLWRVLFLTFLFMLIELGGGLYTHSLALVSDAVHMLTDAAAISLSLFAFYVSQKPANEVKTFGYHRIEILAAKTGVVIELNANPHRLDLDWRLAKYLKEKRGTVSINPDAHSVEGLKDFEFGVSIAKKGWLETSQILNTLPAKKVLQELRRHRR